MTMSTRPVRLYVAMLLAWALLAQAAWAQGGPTRIVVVPFITEAGQPPVGYKEHRPCSGRF